MIAQYYNLVRLGKAGYRAIMLNLMDVRGFLVDEVEKIGRRRSAAEEGSDDDHDDDGSGGGGLFRVLSAKDEKGIYKVREYYHAPSFP